MYVLRFPLRPLNAVTGFDVPVTHVVEGLTLEFCYAAPHIIVTVRGLATREDAVACAKRLWTASRWALVAWGLDSVVELEFDEPTYAADPEQAARNLGFDRPVHGIASGHQPVVFSESTNLRFLTVMDAQATVSTPLSLFLPGLIEGLSLPHADERPDDQRLHLALDLLSAYHREASAGSKLVTLCTVMEVLAETTMRPALVVEHLERWEAQVLERLDTLPQGSEDHFALDSVRKELLRTRETSKRGRVRRLVLDTLGAAEVELAQRAVDAYDDRGTLVHDGSLPPGKLQRALDDAREIVTRILTARLRT